MNRKLFWLLTAILLISLHRAEAQQSTKIPRVGFLSSLTPNVVSDRMEAFRHGLNELGYVERKNILIEYRYAEGNMERVPALATELVHLKVDVILTGGPSVNRFAKEATHKIPIVLAFDNDPVGNGFATSLARPGGNITGLSTLAPEISAKQLEFLRDTVPKLYRVAVLGNVTQPGYPQARREINLAAKSFGVNLQYVDIQNADEIEPAFLSASKAHADAVLVTPSQLVTSHVKKFAEMAVKSRLPAIYWSSEFVDAGGLMSYSVSITELFRRAATYVDKIIKGAKPADLPVEQPEKFELVINLKTARQIGLPIPPNVLARADRVIR